MFKLVDIKLWGYSSERVAFRQILYGIIRRAYTKAPLFESSIWLQPLSQDYYFFPFRLLTRFS